MLRSRLAILLILLGLTAGPPAQAQISARDTTHAARSPTRSAPPGVVRVRQRIAQIGRRGTPVIIYYPVTTGGAGRDADPDPMNSRALDRLEDRLLRRLDRRFDMLYDALNARPPGVSVQFDDRPSEREPAPPTTAADSLPPAPSVDPSEPPAAAPSPVPTVRRIERAILETGLFRALGVNFAFDRSTLLPHSEEILDNVGEVLAAYPALHIEVAGHTDAVGPDAYNQRLSAARAERVRQYLLDRFAIAPERLTARGYGETRPIASNDTPTGRTLNRRVAFRVLNPEEAEQYLEPASPSPAPDTTTSEEGLRRSLRRIVRDELEEADLAPDTTQASP